MILEKLCPLQLEAPKQENPPLKFAFTGNYIEELLSGGGGKNISVILHFECINYFLTKFRTYFGGYINQFLTIHEFPCYTLAPFTIEFIKSDKHNLPTTHTSTNHAQNSLKNPIQELTMKNLKLSTNNNIYYCQNANKN